MPRWPLRRLLLVDAITCAVMGLVLAARSGYLAQLTGIPGALLFWLGLVLLPIAVFMAAVALRNPLPVPGAITVVVGNVLWVLGSVLLLVTPWISPTAFGSAFIAVQAVLVLALASLEMRALGDSGGPVRAPSFPR